MIRFNIRNAALAAMALAFTATAAMADENNPAEAYDPLESLNRLTSGFNSIIRKAFIDPAVDLYQIVTPDPLEHAISNAAANLSEPLTIGSSLLQGDFENAGNASSRFLFNSTFGFAGFGDPATDMGIEARREDLGQALGAQGVGTGPHLVLPILGPSNMRDALGDLSTMLISPMPLVGSATTGAVEYSNNQNTYQSISEGALDPYIAEREAYEQNRRYEVKMAKPQRLIWTTSRRANPQATA